MQGIQVQSLVREQAPTWHVSWPKGGNKGDFPSNSVSMTCTKDSSACGLRWTQFYFIIWLWAMAWEQRNGFWLKKKQYNTPMVQREIDSVGVEMMCLLQGEKLRCIPSRFRKMCLGQQDPWTSRWDNRVRDCWELTPPWPPRWLEPRTQLVFLQVQKRVPLQELRGSLQGSLSLRPPPHVNLHEPMESSN